MILGCVIEASPALHKHVAFCEMQKDIKVKELEQTCMFGRIVLM
jgi:hypothetical protein